MKDSPIRFGSTISFREKLIKLIFVIVIVNVVVVFYISRQCNKTKCNVGLKQPTVSIETHDSINLNNEENEIIKRRLDFLEKLLMRSPLFQKVWQRNSNNTTSNNDTSISTAAAPIKTIKDFLVTGHTKLNAFWAVDDDNYKIHAGKLNDLFTANKTLGHKTRLISTHTCKHKYSTLVLITTHATNFERREIIRKTWGSDPLKSNPRWKTMFLVGRPARMEYSKGLIYEIEKYNDIILGNVNEDFYQLTHKILMGLEWAVNYCSFDYLFKGDDDVFLNMPRLFNFLHHESTPKTGLYTGNAQYQALVQRSGRYAVSNAEFSKTYYPRYCSGGGFVLSRDVVQTFVSTFQNVPILRIDDAYVGVLALKVGVDVLDNKNFRMFEKSCDYKEHTITHHPVKSEVCMKKLFKENLFVKRKAI